MIDAKTVRNRVFRQQNEAEKRIERLKEAKAAYKQFLDEPPVPSDPAITGITPEAWQSFLDTHRQRLWQELDWAKDALKQWIMTLPRQRYKDGLTVYHVDSTGQMHVQKTGRSA